MKLDVTPILEKAVSLGATDLHLTVGAVPYLRINTQLRPFEGMGVLSISDVEYFLSQILDEEQKTLLDVNKELDFSLSLGTKSRFRINAYYQKGYPSVSLRIIPMSIPSLESLNLPATLHDLCNLKQGLILVVGPTGHGKSTTIASMIDKINETRSEHIVSIEDPIEYIFTNKMSLIEQREINVDTHSWEAALKSVLRQDPNIVFIGEMRDIDTMSVALQISETGHLVFATLHTNSASQTIDRIISSFPEESQAEVRLQLSMVLEVIVSQRLLPSADKGMVPAVELVIATDAIKNLIREGRTQMIDNTISTSSVAGMVTLERSLAVLVEKGWVDFGDAVRFSSKPDELRRLLKNSNFKDPTITKEGSKGKN